MSYFALSQLAEEGVFYNKCLDDRSEKRAIDSISNGAGPSSDV